MKEYEEEVRWMEERKKTDGKIGKKIGKLKVEKNKLIIINSIDFSELSV